MTDPNASKLEIDRAYRKKALTCHPDKLAYHGKTGEQAKAEMAAIDAAKKYLLALLDQSIAQDPWSFEQSAMQYQDERSRGSVPIKNVTYANLRGLYEASGEHEAIQRTIDKRLGFSGDDREAIATMLGSSAGALQDAFVDQCILEDIRSAIMTLIREYEKALQPSKLPFFKAKATETTSAELTIFNPESAAPAAAGDHLFRKSFSKEDKLAAAKLLLLHTWTISGTPHALTRPVAEKMETNPAVQTALNDGRLGELKKAIDSMKGHLLLDQMALFKIVAKEPQAATPLTGQPMQIEPKKP